MRNGKMALNGGSQQVFNWEHKGELESAVANCKPIGSSFFTSSIPIIEPGSRNHQSAYTCRIKDSGGGSNLLPPSAIIFACPSCLEHMKLLRFENRGTSFRCGRLESTQTNQKAGRVDGGHCGIEQTVLRPGDSKVLFFNYHLIIDNIVSSKRTT